MAKRKKAQTIIYKALHRKWKIEQYEPHYHPGVNSGASEKSAVPALLVAHVMLLSLQTWWYVINEETTRLWLQPTEHIVVICDTYTP